MDIYLNIDFRPLMLLYAQRKQLFHCGYTFFNTLLLAIIISKNLIITNYLSTTRRKHR